MENYLAALSSDKEFDKGVRLKTKEGSYEELKITLRTDQDGVNKNGNLPYGRSLQRLMPMTHIPENRHQFLARLTCSLVPNFSGTGFLIPVRVSDADFWYVCHEHK